MARSSSARHSPRRGSTRRLLGYLRPYRLRFSLGLLTTTLASLLDGVTLVILIPLLQQIFASAPPPGGGTKLEALVANVLSPLLTGVSPTAATVRLVLLLLVALVLKNALAYVSGQISVQIQESLVRDLRTQLFDHLLRLDLGFFERTRSGQISSRVMQDADASKGVVSAGLASFFQNLVVICTTLLVLTQISWRLTLIALAAAPVLLVTIRALLKRLRRYSRARADEAGEMTASVAERLGAVKLVRAFGGEERESRRFREQASRYRQRTVRAQRLATLTAPLSELFGGLLLVLLIGVGATPAFSGGGALSPQALMVFLVAALKMMAPLKALTQFPNQMAVALGSAERVFEVLDLPLPEAEPPGLAEARFAQAVVFDGVWFEYGRLGRASAAPHWVLQDVSFALPRGSIVALVGPSGAGKSTIAELLIRFREPTRGRILMDDVPLDTLSRSSVRSLMGVVGQDAVLLHDSVHANIAYGRPGASREDVEEAARAANAHDFVTQLPMGYDTVVGERGARLSGGQRQRIAIARALLKDPPILVLDEATSALDPESERLVREAIDRLMQHRTVLVIAHRLSTIRHADLILVLEHGQIIERGTHDSLLAQGGRYRDLYEGHRLERPVRRGRPPIPSPEFTS
ncbi:MAG TPA: ABC transporter ATP-binding protein [Gemmatimonadales bacterium]|nr:ABC transporter ATP-binding protein [Gemmatimonadales bacterium]